MNNDEINNKYNQLLEKHQSSPLSVGWDKARHNLRFHIFNEITSLENKKVLDFGCGTGLLLKYIIQNNIKPKEYIGVDINPKFLDISREIKTEFNKSFILGDFQDISKSIDVDIIISSGVHNIKRDNNKSFNENSLLTFYEMANEVVLVNFLSDKVDYPTKESFHNSPTQILEYAYTITNRILLRNDYMPFEFTLALFKRSKFDTKNVIYEGYDKFI